MPATTFRTSLRIAALAILASAAAVIAPNAAGAATAPTAAPVVSLTAAAATQQVLVTPAKGVLSGTLFKLLTSLGYGTKQLGDSGVVAVSAGSGSRAALIARLLLLPSVGTAAPDTVMSATSVTADPASGQEWGLQNTGDDDFGDPTTAGADADVLPAWSYTTGAGVTVAVADSGSDLSSPDFAGRVVAGYDFVDSDNDPSGTAQQHGTFTSSIIAAARNNGVGGSGVAPDVNVMPLRVMNDQGQGSSSAVIAAIDYAGSHGASVLNLSVGGPGDSSIFQSVAAKYPNMTIVAAAGNDGQSLSADPTYPCQTDAPNVICVGASTQADTAASFSNYSATDVDLFAPGDNIVATAPPSSSDDYLVGSGTSAAAPFVSGAAAMIYALRPSATGASVRALLMQTAKRVPALAGKTASGRLDAGAAITSLPETAQNFSATPAVTLVHATSSAAPKLTLSGSTSYQCSSDTAPAWRACAQLGTATGDHWVDVRGYISGRVSGSVRRSWTQTAISASAAKTSAAAAAAAKAKAKAKAASCKLTNSKTTKKSAKKTKSAKAIKGCVAQASKLSASKKKAKKHAAKK